MCVCVCLNKNDKAYFFCVIFFIVLDKNRLKFIVKEKRFWVGVLCLMAYQLFLGYLMPKPFSKNNSSGTI